MQINELINGDYENSKIYKTKTKAFHDNCFLRKSFEIGQMENTILTNENIGLCDLMMHFGHIKLFISYFMKNVVIC